MIEAFAAAGHEAVHADDEGLGRAADERIADYGVATGRCIVTGDFDFADLRNYPPKQYHGIVVLTIPRGAGSPYMRILLAELFRYLQRGGTVDAKLLIVEPGRIRVRE